MITSGLNHVAHLTTDFLQRETLQSNLQSIKKNQPSLYKVLERLPEFLEANPILLKNLSEDTGLTKDQVLSFMDVNNPEGQIITLARFILKDPKGYSLDKLVVLGVT